MDRYPPGRGVPPPAGKYSAARSHVMNDKYMDDFEKAWEEMRGLGLAGGGPPGGGGGGPGARGGGTASNAAAARAGGLMAAQQRGIYAALEEPYGSPRSSSPSPLLPSMPGGGYGRPGAPAGPSRTAAGGRTPAARSGPSSGFASPAPQHPGGGFGSFTSASASSSPAHSHGGQGASALRRPSSGIGPGSRSAAAASASTSASSSRNPTGSGMVGSVSGSGTNPGNFGGGGAAVSGSGSSFFGGDRPSPRAGAAAAASRSAPSFSAGGGGGGGGNGPMGRYPPRVSLGWLSGPDDPAGVLCDLSDRPNTCSAADWSRGEVVVGSTDHALYVLDATRGLRKRTLYNKSCGHTEWVTCVTYCSDGRIVSGGMDSKLWVWPAGGTRGMAAEGHFGPISQVKYDTTSGLVVSSSYDKTLRLWQLGARPHEAGCLQGHEAPVLEMQVGGDGRIISGDRSGHLLLWDTSSGGVSWRMKNVHAGHITALSWWEEASSGGAAGGGAGGGGGLGGCFVSGGQDGVVRVWDPRAKSNVVKVQLHVNEQGHGAVGDMVAGGPAAAGMLLTAGADGTARTLDPRMGFALAATVRLTNFPYSMTAAGGVAAVGCGDGSIHFIDIQSGRTLYALGANRAAVRCMEASYDKLVCSGDDGKAVLYSFT